MKRVLVRRHLRKGRPVRAHLKTIRLPDDLSYGGVSGDPSGRWGVSYAHWWSPKEKKQYLQRIETGEWSEG